MGYRMWSVGVEKRVREVWGEMRSPPAEGEGEAGERSGGERRVYLKPEL